MYMNSNPIAQCFLPPVQEEEQNFSNKKVEKFKRTHTYEYDEDLTEVENLMMESIQSNLSFSKMRKQIKEIGELLS